MSVMLGNYDLDNAYQYLGPIDCGTASPSSCMEYYTYIISSIAMTILRVINYIFGDHLWYNNQTARDLVITYIQSLETATDIDPEVFRRVERIYHNLFLRSQGCSGLSYADGIPEMLESGGIRFTDPYNPDEDDALINFGSVPDKNTFKLGQGEGARLTFKNGRMGNRTMLEIASKYTQMGFTNEQIEGEVLPSDAENLRRMRHSISREEYHARCSALAGPRTPFPEGFNNGGDRVGTDLPEETRIADFPFDPQYASIKDPEELFKAAILQAKTEYQQLLRIQMDPGGRTSQWIDTCKIAIYNLLKQGSVNLASCHHEVHFNRFVWVCYQKPTLMITNEGEDRIVYSPDLLNSETVGCDPEVAFRLIHSINNDQYVKKCLAYPHVFAHATPEMKNLYNLLTTMGTQLYEKHFKTFNVLVRSPSLPGKVEGSFADYIKDLETPYQIVKQAFAFVTQRYANQGLLAQDDLIDDGSSGEIYMFLCRAAILEILQVAEVVDDFKLRINGHVTITCGRYFGYIPREISQELSCKEFVDEHELCSEESGADVILAGTLMQQSRRGAALLKELILSEDEVPYYIAKGGDDPAILAKPRELRFQVARLGENSREVIQTFYQEVRKLSMCLYYGFFCPKNVCEDLYNEITFNSDVKPTVSKFDPSTMWNQVERVSQDVQWDYVPERLRSQVTIKQRPVVAPPLPEHLKLIQSALTSMNRNSAISHQNQLVDNRARCGNCMYGAMALEIFEGAASASIDYYAGVLRQIAANYMRDHKEKYRRNFVEYNAGERYSPALDGVLDRRLEGYCRKVENNSEEQLFWGTDNELGVLAEVFGVQIQLFHMGIPLKVGSSGEFEGVIQPNHIIGNQFAGAPIRLEYSGGNHFIPVKLRNS